MALFLVRNKFYLSTRHAIQVALNGSASLMLKYALKNNIYASSSINFKLYFNIEIKLRFRDTCHVRALFECPLITGTFRGHLNTVKLSPGAISVH